MSGKYRLAEDWPRYPEDMDFEMGSGVTVDDRGITTCSPATSSTGRPIRWL